MDGGEWGLAGCGAEADPEDADLLVEHRPAEPCLGGGDVAAEVAGRIERERVGGVGRVMAADQAPASKGCEETRRRISRPVRRDQRCRARDQTSSRAEGAR